MPELPHYTGTPGEPDPNQAADPRPAAGPALRWRTVLVAALILVVIAAFLVLHLTGVLGPGEH
jgi:hypothetical protein